MNEFFIATIVGVLQVILSIILIIRQKNIWAIVSEIISALLLLYCLNGFSIQVNNNSLLYLNIVLMEYLFVKIFLVAFMAITRYCSFYIIKRACRKRKKAQIRKLKFVKLFFRAKYWPKLKLGLPGMAGKVHSKTKIRFDEKGFPKFKSFFKVKLKKDLWINTRERHFDMANKALRNELATNSRLKARFTKVQIKQIEKCITPNGYTWHHHQDAGVLQLVDEDLHSKTHHIGGYTIWGSKK